MNLGQEDPLAFWELPVCVPFTLSHDIGGAAPWTGGNSLVNRSKGTYALNAKDYN